MCTSHVKAGCGLGGSHNQWSLVIYQLEGRQRSEAGSISGSSRLFVNISLGEILNPKLTLMHPSEYYLI